MTEAHRPESWHPSVLKLTGIPCCPQLSMGSTNIRASARCAMAKRHQNVWAKRRITWGVYAGSQMQWISFNEISNTLWLFNIAMENGPFIDDFPIKTSIYKGFSMAMLNNQMVILVLWLLSDISLRPILGHWGIEQQQRLSGCLFHCSFRTIWHMNWGSSTHAWKTGNSWSQHVL